MGKKICKITPILIAYLYLLLPIMIFICGWLKWYIAIPSMFIVLMSFGLAIKNIQENNYWLVNRYNIKTLFVAFIIICIWVIFSGIGGLSYQTSDHECRNAIFRALVEYDWPVIATTGKSGLIYYIGFWLPSAIVGKILGVKAGFLFQDIWAVIGLFLVYYFICYRRKKINLWPLLILIFFSGLDYVGTWILQGNGRDLFYPQHLEWWAQDYQFSSITTQLYWVFNQSLPAWLATIIILNEKNKKNILLIASTMMLSSTFPFVGIIPILVFLLLRNFDFTNKKKWKEIFTFQNIIGAGIICLISLLYLIGNLAANEVSGDVSGSSSGYVDMSGLLIEFIIFMLLEVGVYICLIYKYQKKNGLFYVVIALLTIYPWIKVGQAHDFCMRATVPALFILMLLCMDTIEQIYIEREWKRFVPFIVVLLVGAITPFNEIHLSIKETIIRYREEKDVRQEEVAIDDDLLTAGNFSGKTAGNIFYQYLAKDVDMEKQYQHLKNSKIISDEKEILYTEKYEFERNDYYDLSEKEIKDTDKVVKELKQNKMDFYISSSNFLQMIENDEKEVSNLLSNLYICTGRFKDGTLYFTYKEHKRFTARNIIVIANSNIDIQDGVYYAEKESKFSLYNPYNECIDMRLSLNGKLNEKVNKNTKIFVNYNDNEIIERNIKNTIEIAQEINVVSGVSMLDISLDGIDNDGQTVYQINDIKLSTDCIYDEVNISEDDLVVLEKGDVSVVTNEVILEENSDIEKIIKEIKSNKNKLLISENAFRKILSNNLTEINKIFREQYNLKKQYDKYLLFEIDEEKKDEQDAETINKKKMFTCIDEMNQNNGTVNLWIYSPYAKDIQSTISIDLRQISELLDENNIVTIDSGNSKVDIPMNEKKRVIDLGYVLKPGFNLITLTTNMQNYIYKDDEKIYYTVKNVKVKSVN